MFFFSGTDESLRNVQERNGTVRTFVIYPLVHNYISFARTGLYMEVLPQNSRTLAFSLVLSTPLAASQTKMSLYIYRDYDFTQL